MSKRGKILIITAPSGTGKDTVMEMFTSKYPGFRFCRSVTTREKIPGEVEGASYFFISKEEYDRMDKAGELIESIEYVGNKYGTRFDEIDNAIESGENLIMILSHHGMEQIKRHYENDVIAVFMFPPSLDELRRRLVTRGRETAEQIEQRMGNASNEIATAVHYKYFVVNKRDEVEQCADDIYNIIKECCQNESKEA